MCAGFSIAVLRSENNVYFFDSHRRNSDGFHDTNGNTILLELFFISSLNNYLSHFMSLWFQ